MELFVEVKDKKYSIHIQKELINHVNEYCQKKYKVFVITDDGVPNTYFLALKKQFKNIELFSVPQGENSKSLETYQKIIDRLIKLRYSRKDYIIGLGGGMVLDLSGFVAATFKRGMRFISIPTTTLAMVDASIGGKVALNYNGIKNMIGTFYHPEVVLIDPNTLETLPKRHYTNGIIEALKTGIIGDENLYRLFFEKDYKKNIEEIIYRSLTFKANIVKKDEKEEKERKILNFGHTFGHAYEAYFSMKNYLHGEAVALGMLTVSKKEPYFLELKSLLDSWKVKTEINVDSKKILGYVYNDKKINQDTVELILVPKIGQVEIVNVSLEQLNKYMEQ